MENEQGHFSSSFDILIYNNALLKSKIEQLPSGKIYQSEINEYLGAVNGETFKRPNSSYQRTKRVADTLKALWVKKHEKIETYHIIEEYPKFEEILFRQEHYRDHYIHQFNVFLLGYYILNKLTENELIKTVFGNNIEKTNFTWMLASTFHDMGYPIEQIDNWFSEFLKVFLKVDDIPYKIEIERLLTPNFFEYVKYLSATNKALENKQIANFSPEAFFNRDWKFENILLTGLRKKDHGVISALLLIHSFLTQESFAQNREWIYDTLPYQIMPACHAISVHNLIYHTAGLQVKFKNTPIAFLLALCDELQDWGRSQRGDYSKLVGVDIDVENDRIPTLTFTLEIINEDKRRTLKILEEKLQGDNKLRVLIEDDKGSELCRIK